MKEKFFHSLILDHKKAPNHYLVYTKFLLHADLVHEEETGIAVAAVPFGHSVL